VLQGCSYRPCIALVQRTVPNLDTGHLQACSTLALCPLAFGGGGRTVKVIAGVASHSSPIS
jgi:hypothetical protein